MRRLSILTAIIFFTTHLAAQTEIKISPKATDSSIDNWTEDHYVYINKNVSQAGILFLYFPGSGSIPSTSKLILKEAANMGYHAVGLNYPNTYSVSDFCGQSTDKDCHEKVRMEVIDGMDRTDLISISVPNSILNRIYKLLVYLKTNFPNDGWNNFIKENI